MNLVPCQTKHTSTDTLIFGILRNLPKRDFEMCIYIASIHLDTLTPPLSFSLYISKQPARCRRHRRRPRRRPEITKLACVRSFYRSNHSWPEIGEQTVNPQALFGSPGIKRRRLDNTNVQSLQTEDEDDVGTRSRLESSWFG
ncbi:hypothetical protein HanIR_Chr03g0107471 [Helianthus annuus]|nr:hypothetical protein HanIR_Chr03g0107471 [Helianthus annuus]